MSGFPLAPADAVAALCGVNVLAFAAFGVDKALAEAGRRRIAERRLLWFAALGGTAGAYAARALFRHKTRKQPFSDRLLAIALVQMLAAVGLIGWFWRG